MTAAGAVRAAGVVAGVAALAVTLGACTSDGGGTGGGAATGGSTPVTIGAVFTTATVPIWLAEEEGIFDKYGLDVTIQQSPNFAASVPSVLNGQMEFANAATTPFITAINEGVPVQIVAGVSVLAPVERDGNLVIVQPDSGIERPKDLEGKTVATLAVGAGPTVGVIANYLADGGAPDGIDWVVMGLTEQLPALEDGSIDAAVMAPPFSGQAEAAGYPAGFNAYLVDGLDVIPTGFTDAVLLASDQYLADNPDVGERMRDAMIEANDYAQQNPDRVRETLVEYIDLDPTTAETVAIPDYNGVVDPADIQRVIDAMSGAGLIADGMNADEIVWMP
ncbi:ABC transporter substrate-binding protein [Microbacterium sp.]|uniref:ABC transporter substrate-binding protein n=1 Tax=Microbacterium sp. TaxID=51671 RepID=UPI003A8AAFFF